MREPDVRRGGRGGKGPLRNNFGVLRFPPGLSGLCPLESQLASYRRGQHSEQLNPAGLSGGLLG